MELQDINIEQKKIRIIENILQLDNLEIVNEIHYLLNNNIQKYTVEEYKKEIQEAEDDIKNNRLISNEELKVKLGI